MTETSPSMKSQGRVDGFTIVELLVIIVVIGVLAAVSVATYSGLSRRAEVSVVKSSLTQGVRKIAAYSVTHDGPPDSVEELKLPESDSISYMYYRTDEDYCLSARSGVTRLYSRGNGAVLEGVCATTYASDDFNRANGGLGPGWAVTGNFAIDSEVALGSNRTHAVINAAHTDTDFSVKVMTSSGWGGIYVRSNANLANGYKLEWLGFSGRWYLERMTGGGYVILDEWDQATSLGGIVGIRSRTTPGAVELEVTYNGQVVRSYRDTHAGRHSGSHVAIWTAGTHRFDDVTVLSN